MNQELAIQELEAIINAPESIELWNRRKEALGRIKELERLDEEGVGFYSSKEEQELEEHHTTLLNKYRQLRSTLDQLWNAHKLFESESSDIREMIELQIAETKNRMREIHGKMETSNQKIEDLKAKERRKRSEIFAPRITRADEKWELREIIQGIENSVEFRRIVAARTALDLHEAICARSL